MQLHNNPTHAPRAKTIKRRRPAQQRVANVINHHPVSRQASASNVASAMLLPITLPLRGGWWLLCHPLQAIIVAFAVYWAIPMEWIV